MEESLLENSTNNLPLPDELVPLWNGCLDDLSRQSISSLENKDHLLNPYLELYERRELVASFRSSVRRLPAELIARIMYLSLQLHQRELGDEGRQLFRTLRSVSSLWRSTALTTPTLWRSLEVDLSSTTWAAAAVTSWFSRGGVGGPCRLSVVNSQWFADVASLDEILAFIDGSPFTFSSLTFSLPTLSDISNIVRQSAARRKVKNLSILLPCSIALHQNRMESFLRNTVRLDDAFPQAESIVFRAHFQQVAALAHSSLASLALHAGHTTPSYFSRLSECFPSLLELTITSTVFVDYTEVSLLPPIHLESLQRLTLHGTNIDFIRALSCSRLRWFHLVDAKLAQWSDPASPRYLASFVQRSQATDFTLQITQSVLEQILPIILIQPLAIHRLHIPDIAWLGSQDAHSFFHISRIPSSLRKIVTWGRSDTSECVPSHLGQPGSAEPGQWSPRTIDVYVPAGQDDLGRVWGECDEQATGIRLLFHCLGAEEIQVLLHGSNPILCHEYDNLLRPF
ncbi:hypothetical protein BKA70DRAFT_1316840 [Coprinopsis sp. MPI-PUGE-AT-0042]|nr:hypothetical protein BKA70DRAFT_1316840 [Coprinopsis sp. MPI-PUGE-AT-0042]